MKKRVAASVILLLSCIPAGAQVAVPAACAGLAARNQVAAFLETPYAIRRAVNKLEQLAAHRPRDAEIRSCRTVVREMWDQYTAQQSAR